MIASASEFVGQARARALLARYIERGRLGGTFLLLGQRGLGKTTLATIIARALCCTGARTPDEPLSFCGECYACRSIAAGEQPEYVTVRPSGQNISVKQLDEDHGGLHTALYHPNLLSHRVFVIDNAHYLNEESGNRLLKLFEEAPEKTVFFLTTDRPELLLPTIHSRGQKITLTPLPAAELAEALAAQGVALQDAVEAAALSGGRYVDALALSGNAAWRAGLRELAAAIMARRNVLEAAADAAEFEHSALWEKEQADHGMEEAELSKTLPKARQNELVRQALISAYDRASWWMLNDGTRNSEVGERDPQTANRAPQTAHRKPQTANRKPQTASVINMDDWQGGERKSEVGARDPQTTNRSPQTANRKPQPGPLGDPDYMTKLATLRRRISGNVDRELAQMAFEASL